MTKKMYTLQIDETTKKTSVGSKSTKPAKAKKTVAQKEVENFGIVEINNAGASKKLKNKAEIGYEKNFTGEKKKAVKAEHSQVEDYFDFCFKRGLDNKESPVINFLNDDFDEDFDVNKKFMELMFEYGSKEIFEDDLNQLSEILASYAKAETASEKVATAQTKETAKAKTAKKAIAKKTTAKKTKEKKVTAKKQTTKAVKKAEETVVEKDNKTSTILKVVPENLEEIRSVSMEAQVCDRFVYDDEAKYNISVARLGSLFDCEKRMLN